MIIIKLKKKRSRLPDSDKYYLKHWLSNNMTKRIDSHTLEMLSNQTSLSLFQVQDFLKDEKARIKKKNQLLSSS